MASFRSDVAIPFVWPVSIPLTKTLDDVLEEDVEERYYLQNDRIEGLLTSTIDEMRKRNGYKFKVKKRRYSKFADQQVWGGQKDRQFHSGLTAPRMG